MKGSISVKLFSFFFCIILLCTYSQKEVVLIAGGYITDDNRHNPCYWKDGSIVELLPGYDSWNGYAENIAYSGQDIYVSGMIENVGLNPLHPEDETKIACFWKNDGESILLTDMDTIGVSTADDIIVNNGDINIAGLFSEKGSYIEKPCYWKNSERFDFSVEEEYQDAYVYALAFSGDTMISGGCIISDSWRAVPCYWKNNQLNYLPLPSDNTGGLVTDIFLYDNNLFFCGAWSELGSNSPAVPCYWKNDERTDIKSRGDVIAAYATAISIREDKVYICGIVSDSSNKIHPVYYSDGEWIYLESGKDDVRAYADTIIVTEKNVRVSGYYLDKNNIQHPCYWKDGKRFRLPVADETQGGYAAGMYIY